MFRLLLLLLLLTGCGQNSDDYTFESSADRVYDPKISVVTYPSRKAFAASWTAGKRPENLMAYSVLKADGRCIIHMVDPKVEYDPSFYGHELTHCLYRNWHPTQGVKPRTYPSA